MTMVSDFRSDKKEKKHSPCIFFCVRYGFKYGTSILKTVRLFGVRNNPSGCTDVQCTEQQNACTLPTSVQYINYLRLAQGCLDFNGAANKVT